MLGPGVLNNVLVHYQINFTGSISEFIVGVVKQDIVKQDIVCYLKIWRCKNS